MDWSALLAHPDVRALIELALREDIGAGDVTTRAVFASGKAVVANIVCRRPTVVAGLPVAAAVFRAVSPDIELTPRANEGARIPSGASLCELRGDVRGILTGERCALNFLMRLSGIAMAARTAVERIPQGARAKVYDTRKTVPGWRLLDKAAVKIGGAENHRIGLFDAVLIKDNHIAAAGSLSAAVERARRTGLSVEVEIDGLHQLDEALAARPDIILLDNFDDAGLEEAAMRTASRVILEASGGVTLERLPAIAKTGVDRISMGALTHSVTPADLSLELPS